MSKNILSFAKKRFKDNNKTYIRIFSSAIIYITYLVMPLEFFLLRT